MSPFYLRRSPPRKKSEAFATALQEARREVGVSQSVFGQLIGASQRTLTRWEMSGELPHVPQRTHMIVRLAAALSTAKLMALARALGVDKFLDVESLSLRARRVSASDMANMALPGALLAYAEELDLSPREARRALTRFLEMMEPSRASVAEMRAALERVAPAKGK